MTNDNESLSHTKWCCRYHIVFAKKYRRKEIYGRIKGGHRENTQAARLGKESRDTKGRSLYRSYTHVG